MLLDLELDLEKLQNCLFLYRSWTLAGHWGESFLESILQHDPKTVQMDLMMGPKWHQKPSLCWGKRFLEKMTAT